MYMFQWQILLFLWTLYVMYSPSTRGSATRLCAGTTFVRLVAIARYECLA